MTLLFIIGAGAHGRMLWTLTGMQHGMGDWTQTPPDGVRLLNGVGNVPHIGDPGLTTRAKVYDAYADRIEGYDDPTAVIRARSCHPSTQVFARAVLNTDSIVGANCIINTGAIVEHDCVVGDHCHIAPGVVLLGGVRVGALTHIGAGAIVLPNVVIGDRVVIGAGAVVTRDVDTGATVLPPRGTVVSGRA